MRWNPLLSVVCGIVLLAASLTGYGQTIVIVSDTPAPLPRPWHPPSPRPPAMSYHVKQLAIQARVRNQMADVQVTQSFVNKSSTTIQAQFVFRSNTLYKRGKLVVTPETASLDLERDKDKIKKLKRFSEEYFALVKDNKESENQVLSQQSNDDQLLVLIRGVNYLIE